MKVSSLYIATMIASLQLLASPGTGQGLEDIKVTVELKNEKLEKLFNSIHDQTGLLFTFFPEQVDAYDGITLSKATRSVKATLDMVLGNTPLTYKQVNNNIIILAETANVEESKAPVLSKVEYKTLATITGKVTDVKTNLPMAGVNIIVKGTLNGTTTDAEGKFAIDAEDKDILMFSFIGYQTFETQVSGRLIIDVAMSLDITALKEVEINAGYWNIKEKMNTGNITRVSSEDIQRQPVTNPLAALQGRMPGVYIQQESGVPGSGFTVRVRGRNSIISGNDPLYIIDGIPYVSETLSSNSTSGAIIPGSGPSPLNSINIQDIESIEILKDADATAIYGSRGANGVVLITTKKGHTGKTNIDINFYKGFGNVTKGMDLLSTQQYIEMRKEAYKNDGISPSGAGARDLLQWDTTRYTDWQHVLIGGTSNTTNAQLSISGGQSNTQFLFSGAYYKETTVFPGDFGYHKASSHFSVSHASQDQKFKATFSTSFIADNNNLLANDLARQAMSLSPNSPALYDENGNLNWENSTWTNPLRELEQKYKATTNNLLTNVKLSYEILNGLQVKTNFGINNLQMKESKITPSSYYDPALGLTSSVSSSILNTSSVQSWIMEPQINWQRKIALGQLTFLLGTTFQTREKEQLVQLGSGFSSDALIENIAAASLISMLSYNNLQYRYNAIFGRANYDWRGKYLFNLTARRDGSSRFGPGNRFANFGAIGAAWIFSNEELIKNSLRFITFGKLRGSYGTTGNDQIGDYGYLDTFSVGGTYQGLSSLTPTKLYNAEFAWELNRKVEVGLELGLLEDDVFLTTSYYQNRSSNQLVGYRVPRTTGFTSILANLPATVQNSGWEVELTAITSKSDLFKWSTSFNITIPRNKLLEFPGLEASTYANQYVVGKPLDIRKVYRSAGVDPVTGIWQFDDMNGDGTVSSADRLHIENVGQKYYGGMSNNFTFKGLSLDVFVQFVKQSGLSHWFSTSSYAGSRSNQPKSVLNRWRNDGTVTDYQRFSTGLNAQVVSAFNNYRSSEAAVTDASFVRIKNISLSYQFSSTRLIGVKARVYVQGQNLWTITNYEGADPENQAATLLSPLRMLTIGCQLTF